MVLRPGDVAGRAVPRDLAQIVRSVTVTTPASTTIAAPQSTTVQLGAMRVERVEVVVPSGHSGLTGVALRYSGTRILPFAETEWLVANDEVLDFDVGLEVGGPGLQVVTYNLDESFAHSHHLRFVLVVPQAVERPALFAVPSPFELPSPAELPSEELEPLPFLSEQERQELIAAGYDPEEAMSMLEEILSNTRAIMARLDIAGGAPGETLPELGTVVVPRVVGLDVNAATAQLASVGLGVEVVTQPSTAASGAVLEQDPPAGTEVEEGGVVALTVAVTTSGQESSAGRVEVPDVVGLTVDRARAKLQRVGLKASVTRVRSDEPRDRVVGQKPLGGARRPVGDTVALRVSRGR